MQYVILIYDAESAYEQASEDVLGTMYAQHAAFGEGNDAAVQGGKELQSTSTATCVRPDGAGSYAVTDGPFAETKEALGGFYVVDAPDLDAAIELAKQVPVFPGGGLEIRPVAVHG